MTNPHRAQYIIQTNTVYFNTATKTIQGTCAGQCKQTITLTLKRTPKP